MDSSRIRLVKRLCHVYSDMYHGNTFHSLKYFLVVNVVIIMVIWFLLNVGISEGVFKELLCSYYRMSHLVITLPCGICCIRPFRFLSLAVRCLKKYVTAVCCAAEFSITSSNIILLQITLLYTYIFRKTRIRCLTHNATIVFIHACI